MMQPSQVHWTGTTGNTVVISVVYCATLIIGAPFFAEMVGLKGTAAQMMETYLRWLGFSDACLWSSDRCNIHLHWKQNPNAAAVDRNSNQCIPDYSPHLYNGVGYCWGGIV